MKKLLVLISLLTLPALAQMPEYLKDGEITVTLKDGSVHKFSSNDFKVVPRVQAKPESIVVVAPEKKQRLKNNQLIFHAGVGKDGLRVNSNSNSTHIEEKGKGVAGLTYCRGIEVELGLCASAFTNETFTLGISLEF